MTGLLISEIAVWSAHRCRLVPQACLPSWFPFWAALGCRCRLVSQACFPSSLPFWAAFGCRCRLVSQACLPSWFPFWAALGCRGSSYFHSPDSWKLKGSYFSMTGLLIGNRQLVANLSLRPYNSQACLPSWFPFWASPGYGCRPVSQASLPPWFPFWAALGYSRLVSQACLLSRWAALRRPPCFLSLSSSFLLGCSWLQLPPCLPVLSSSFPLWSYSRMLKSWRFLVFVAFRWGGADP